jgi:hypothetical protein
MLQLAGGKTLGVHIADFLDLESGFEGRSVVNPPADGEHMLS